MIYSGYFGGVYPLYFGNVSVIFYKNIFTFTNGLYPRSTKIYDYGLELPY